MHSVLLESYALKWRPKLPSKTVRLLWPAPGPSTFYGLNSAHYMLKKAGQDSDFLGPFLKVPEAQPVKFSAGGKLWDC
jgi:hypothetical protein